MRSGMHGFTMGLALAATLLGVGACGVADATGQAGKANEAAAGVPRKTGPMAESSLARIRIESVRARFLVPEPAAHEAHEANAKGAPALPLRGAKTLAPALGPSAVERFESVGGYVRPEITASAKRGSVRTATVALPVAADEPVRVKDDGSNLGVSFTMRGASNAPMAQAGGVALYSSALAGADVLHRVLAEGTEDYVVFEQRPEKEEFTYDVNLSRVAGLRLVNDTLEMLDEKGTPRLRVAPPYVVDAKGAKRAGALAVEGCAFDTSPKAPWGRAVTKPGASRCAVRVSWHAASYPAMVDPLWTATGSMTAARDYPTATVLGSGQVLVAGGDDGTVSLASAELYDPTSRTFAATGSMATARVDFTATMLGSGQVLVVGGIDDTGTEVASAELYDPTGGTFSATGSLSTARGLHTATALGSGAVLVAGGLDTGGNPLASTELYDPSGATFSVTGSLAAARYLPTATLLGTGSVLVVGGFDGTNALASAELYDPTGATFSATGSMSTGRYLDVAVLLGSGQVLVAGGTDGATSLTSAELYDPTGATATLTGSMTTARYGLTATVLGGGQVVMAGGFDGANNVASAEIYDPTGGTFAPTTPMTSVRYLHVAALLGDGTVFEAGGQDVNSAPLSSAETFIAGTTLTTDQSSYSVGSSIVVTWTGLPGNPKDWVAIAPAGSPLSTTSNWTYTGGTTIGSFTFSGLTSPGSYVVRAFANDTYSLIIESAPFTINAGSATVSTDQSSYGPGQSITVTWTGLPGTPTDWIALAPQGSSDGITTTWLYTNGSPSGSVTFSGGIPTTGTYVARAFPSNGYYLAAESTPFSIGSSAASVSTNQSTYGPGDDVTVTWSGLPGNPQDWIALAPAGSPVSDTVTWVYTGGAGAGSYTFAGGAMSVGSFVARAFLNNTYTLAGESPTYVVSATTATVSTDLSAYSLGQDIVVMWSGMPGGATDWVALAPQGSPLSNVSTWVYTGGTVSGSYTFVGGLSMAGTYVARMFPNNTYDLASESGPFTVN